MAKLKMGGIFFEKELLMSEAFLGLGRISILVLLHFYSKRQMKQIGPAGKKKWIIANNGDISFTYKEAERKFKISNRTFTRAIDELIERGFIDIARYGDGTGGGHRSRYSIEERWRKFGKEDFVYKKRKKSSRKLGFLKTKPTDKKYGTTADKNAGTTSNILELRRQKCR